MKFTDEKEEIQCTHSFILRSFHKNYKRKHTSLLLRFLFLLLLWIVTLDIPGLLPVQWFATVDWPWWNCNLQWNRMKQTVRNGQQSGLNLIWIVYAGKSSCKFEDLAFFAMDTKSEFEDFQIDPGTFQMEYSNLYLRWEWEGHRRPKWKSFVKIAVQCRPKPSQRCQIMWLWCVIAFRHGLAPQSPAKQMVFRYFHFHFQ